MMIATVITCPQRFDHYRRFLRNFAALNLGFPVRTFQTKEAQGDAFANNNLNARAALRFAQRHLEKDGWILYLEDDVVLHPALAQMLPELARIGNQEGVDCWNLCNRKNNFKRQFRVADAVIKELDYPILGGHGLLIPQRHLAQMIEAHWSQVSDQAMFAAINHPNLRVWQVVKPVLVEHFGFISTYNPEDGPKVLEVNHAD
ncbi:MAG: hypothetical protein JWM16_4496 [Verrucomicrobiales bacterium]|nr:hypothetical protein [Verrucomicrobiales bacterium]